MNYESIQSNVNTQRYCNFQPYLYISKYLPNPDFYKGKGIEKALKNKGMANGVNEEGGIYRCPALGADGLPFEMTYATQTALKKHLTHNKTGTYGARH